MLPFLIIGLSRLSMFAVTADCSQGTQNLKCETGLPGTQAGTAEVQSLLRVVFAVIAGVAILMIVISGFRFITAQGNPQEVAKARNTIIYSLVGLVVAIAAEAIVALVLGKTQ